MGCHSPKNSYGQSYTVNYISFYYAELLENRARLKYYSILFQSINSNDTWTWILRKVRLVFGLYLTFRDPCTPMILRQQTARNYVNNQVHRIFN